MCVSPEYSKRDSENIDNGITIPYTGKVDVLHGDSIDFHGENDGEPVPPDNVNNGQVLRN